MKKYIFFFFPLLLIMSTSWSLSTPNYLSVENWKRCVSSKTEGTAQFWCLPVNKPNECPNASWDKLTSEQLIDRC